MATVLLSTQRIQLFSNTQETATLDVTNVSSAPILFHLLTTSPGRYIVKHKKGVLKPNSTAHVLISLSASQIPNHSATEELIKDTFLLEYALLEPADDVDPSFSNIAALIKAKKLDKKVVKKQISCRVFLQGPPAQGSKSKDAKRLTPAEAQAHTLAEKTKRQSQGTVQKSGGGMSKMTQILGVLVLAVVVMFAGMWFLE